MSSITLCARFKCIGSNSIYKWFACQAQYEYTAKTWRLVDNLTVEDTLHNKYMYHYTIEVDDVTYYIPGCYCAEYDVPYDSPYVTDKIRHEEYMWSNEEIKDFIKMYKEITGRDLHNKYSIEWNYKKIEEITGLSCQDLKSTYGKYLPGQNS